MNRRSTTTGPALTRMLAMSVAMLVVATCARSVHAAVIYFDDFSGGATALNGTTPDTRPGAETWTASTTGVTWLANGSIAGSGADRNAWLPFTPSAGNVYELSLVVNPTLGATANWFALGFAATGSTTAGFTANPPNSVAWILQRVDRDDAPDVSVSTFRGPTNTGGVAHSGVSQTGPVELSVILDTRPTLWTAEWFYEGVSIRGPVAFASNPTINVVGFGRFGTAGGTVDNFTLSIVPAPAALPAGLALLVLIVTRRHRTR